MRYEAGKEVTFVSCMVCRSQKLLGVCMPLRVSACICISCFMCKYLHLNFHICLCSFNYRGNGFRVSGEINWTWLVNSYPFQFAKNLKSISVCVYVYIVTVWSYSFPFWNETKIKFSEFRSEIFRSKRAFRCFKWFYIIHSYCTQFSYRGHITLPKWLILTKGNCSQVARNNSTSPVTCAIWSICIVTNALGCINLCNLVHTSYV